MTRPTCDRAPTWALALAVSALFLLASLAAADEPVDLEMVNRIRAEGFHRSQVMETVAYLTDTIGPRLTGSPAWREAHEWTRERLSEWGLENAELEVWGPFGRGWSFSRASIHLVEPRELPLLGLPKAWTPGTDGPLRGIAVQVKIESEDDFEEYRGELEGKILLLDQAAEIEPAEKVPFDRFTPDELADMEEFKIPSDDGDKWRKKARKRWHLQRALNDFLVEEKVLATLGVSSRNHGVLRLTGGGSREADGNPGVPAVVITAEQYNWLLRLLDDEVGVELEIDVTARFYDDNLMAMNTVAEIPGTDKADEIVMVGGHLDSWHAGTGSNDNAAGCAVAMEAVRILQALDVKPRRTIRIGLWAAEEQGLLGSQAYVRENFATRPAAADEEEAKMPPYLWQEQWPITVKPAHARLSAYFNLDNGSGKIRGIYTQENAAVLPIFEAWLGPFADLGADTVTNRNTRGTDHLAFDRVGLPGFQFIQDRLDYFTRTHHSNLDVYDHAQSDDLMQASVVMASFLYHAAMRDEMLPRKPMPQKPPARKETENGEEDEG